MDLVVTTCAPLGLQAHPAPFAATPKPPLAKPAPQPVLIPVMPPASAEAVVMQNARPAPPTGIEFDDVPFTGDAAILVDDIVRPDADSA